MELGKWLFGHGRSIGETVQKPATVFLVAIDPYLREILTLGAVVVALAVLSFPPAGGDAFRSPGAYYPTILFLQNHAERRTIRNDRSHINRLRDAKQPEGTSSRQFRVQRERVCLGPFRVSPRNESDRVLRLRFRIDLHAHH